MNADNRIELGMSAKQPLSSTRARSAKRALSVCDLGPIRPPSESASLLIRVTRNCPWNKCLFCPVYKGKPFEKRTEEAVMDEIDLLADTAERLKQMTGSVDEANGSPATLPAVVRDRSASYEERRMAIWLHRGDRTVFLQDADSLVRPAHRIERILRHLVSRFPDIARVCTYARSRTLAAKTVEDLRALREAGLSRIHVGVESGSDAVLRSVQKGCTAAHHIEGIGRAVEAGFEVCCYVMPGLGGRALSDEHVRGTAQVLRAARPHTVRLRTLFVTPDLPLWEKVSKGEMTLLEEDEVVAEIRSLIRLLKGMDGRVVSDHERNLMTNITGHLTNDAEALDEKLTAFLNLPQSLKEGFVAARRSGRVNTLASFLADEKLHPEMETLALSLKQEGGGSLLKGIIERFPPSLL